MNREDDCVEHMHVHVGQCTRRGYANGFADGAAQGLAALLSTCDRTPSWGPVDGCRCVELAHKPATPTAATQTAAALAVANRAHEAAQRARESGADDGPDWHDEWCDANGCRCKKCPCSCGYAERAEKAAP